MEGLRRNSLRIVLNLAVVGIFMVCVSLGNWPFLAGLEHQAYDARLLLTLPGSTDPGVVIVDIDERSLQSQGRWPWPRARLAALVDSLVERYRVKLIGFDMVFAEPDLSSGMGVLEELGKTRFQAHGELRQALEALAPELDFDRRFADSLRGRPVILGYFFNVRENIRSGVLPTPSLNASALVDEHGQLVSAIGFGANLAQLQSAALGAGHINPLIDEDGLVRRVPMLIRHEGQIYESFALRICRAVLSVRDIEPVFSEDGTDRGDYSGLEWLRIGERWIPVDHQGATLVPYRGYPGSYTYVSASDVLTGKVAPEILDNAIVLVGTTAPGLLDSRATPVQNVYPGVEVHANLISGILDQTLKQRPPYTLGVELVCLFLLGLAMALLPLLSPLASTVLVSAALLVVIAGNLAAWQAGLVLPIASLLFMLVVLYTLNMSLGFFYQSRRERKLKNLFGHYVPPTLVEEMSRNPDSYSLEAESRAMTVMFADVRGFTSLSEGLEPRELAALINRFLTPMTRIIHRHRGTIDKYMGDAVMAFWGAPISDQSHAGQAVAAALEMAAQVQDLREEFITRGWPSLRIGIGVNTGHMSVGNMGSEFRTAYTVLGDAVNLGARLEGLTKAYGVSVVVSEYTAGAAPDFLYRELDRVRVKGKDVPVRIFEPLCPLSSATVSIREWIARHDRALACYRAGDWECAERWFCQLERESAGAAGELYRVYLERVGGFRVSPPPADWDGVFTHLVK